MINREDVITLIGKYKEEMAKPMEEKDGQVYDEGYIDGIVDLLGDLITFLDLSSLNIFADEMDELQQKIYDRRVLN